jgi:hypothetical protein
MKKNKIKIIKNKIMEKFIKKYHWLLVIILCITSTNMNWGNEPGSGGGIAILIIFIWIIFVWPIIYFWNNDYSISINATELENLTIKENLLKYLFHKSSEQAKYILDKLFLFFYITGPVSCAIFPTLINQTDSINGFAHCFLFILFFNYVYRIIMIYKRRKMKNVLEYYLSNKVSKVKAWNDNENDLNIEVNNKKLNLGKIFFLPFSIEDCLHILNQD